MATFFRTKVQKDIGTTPANVLATTSNNRFTLIGFTVANKTDYDVIIDVTVTDPLAVTGYFIKQLIIPPYNSAKLITNGEKLILAENTTLTIVSDTSNGCDAIISYAEII